MQVGKTFVGRDFIPHTERRVLASSYDVSTRHWLRRTRSRQSRRGIMVRAQASWSFQDIVMFYAVKQ